MVINEQKEPWETHQLFEQADISVPPSLCNQCVFISLFSSMLTLWGEDESVKMILSLSCPAQGKALKIQYAETLGSPVTSPDLISPTLCKDPASPSRQPFFPPPQPQTSSWTLWQNSSCSSPQLNSELGSPRWAKIKCHPKDGAAFSIIHELQLPGKVYLGANVSSVAPS